MRPFSRSRALILALGIVPACGLFDSGGGGGGGSSGIQVESEPNEGIQFSDPILIGKAVQGDVSEAGDEDWFSLKLNLNRTVQVELLATRLDQEAWDAAGTGPRLSVVFPLEDDKLTEHSLSSGWAFGAQDFDIPLLRTKLTGTYWFVVRADTDLAAGGRYALRVSYAPEVPTQFEIEGDLETDIDDTPGTSQTISPGLLMGFHRDANEDFYSLSIGGPRVVRLELVSARNGAYANATSVYDPILRLYDTDGSTVIAENDDAFFLDPAIQHEVAGGGTYRVQVTQDPASTVDAPYFLHVSTDPAAGTVETEPNDAPATADPLSYGQDVTGVTGPGAEDWFRFTGTAGDMVRLQVFDRNNSQSASEVMEVAYIAPDGTTPLTFHEGPTFQVMTTILQQDGTYYVRARTDPGAVGATTYRLELRRFHTSTYESEPNDTIAADAAFPGSGYAAGVIAAAGDVDLYRFNASSRQLVVFAVYAGDTGTGNDGFSEYSGHGSALAPLLTIRDTTGAVLASSTSQPAGSIFAEGILQGLPTASVSFVASPTASVYYVEVAAADGTGSAEHYYVLQKR